MTFLGGVFPLLEMYALTIMTANTISSCSTNESCIYHNHVKNGVLADYSNLRLSEMPGFANNFISINVSRNLIQHLHGKISLPEKRRNLKELQLFDISNNRLLKICGFRKVTRDLPFTNITVLNANYLECDRASKTMLFASDVAPLLETKLEELYINGNNMENSEKTVTKNLSKFLRVFSATNNRWVWERYDYLQILAIFRTIDVSFQNRNHCFNFELYTLRSQCEMLPQPPVYSNKLPENEEIIYNESPKKHVTSCIQYIPTNFTAGAISFDYCTRWKNGPIKQTEDAYLNLDIRSIHRRSVAAEDASIFEMIHLVKRAYASGRLNSKNQTVTIQNKDVFKNLDKDCPTFIWIIFVSVCCIIAVAAIICVVLVYRFRWKLRYWYYVVKRAYGYHRLTTPDDYQFDAFVSYADNDRYFPRCEMVKHLEKQRGFRLCIHHRDFIAGCSIAENITNAIHNSRKMICLLTEDFIRSDWCKYEFNIANVESTVSRQGQNMIILLMLNGTHFTNIPLDIMLMISEETYIQYPDGEEYTAVFWDRLADSLK